MMEAPVKKVCVLVISLVLLSMSSCVKEPVDVKPEDYKPVINEVSVADFEDKRDDTDFDELVNDYENEDRQNWQKPRAIIQSLGDLSDKVVADIGAGTGYFTLRFLPLAQKVIAIDIDSRMTEFIEDLKGDLDDRFSEKLETRLATASNPKLQDGEVDIIFMSNTYGYIRNRIAYCRKLKSKLKPGGSIVIIDYKKKQIPIHPDQNARVALFEAEIELVKAGFEIVRSDDQTLPYQYIIEVR